MSRDIEVLRGWIICIYGSKMIILEEDTDVEVGVGVGVWETSTRGGGRGKRVDRWVVRGVFRD